jgi:hypothetical protein
MDEIGRRNDASIDMALGGEIDHPIVAMPGDDLPYGFSVGDIGPDKLVAFAKAEWEIGGCDERTCIGQKINIGDALGLIMFQDVAYEVTADKSASARYKQSHPSVFIMERSAFQSLSHEKESPLRFCCRSIGAMIASRANNLGYE